MSFQNSDTVFEGTGCYIVKDPNRSRHIEFFSWEVTEHVSNINSLLIFNSVMGAEKDILLLYSGRVCKY